MVYYNEAMAGDLRFLSDEEPPLAVGDMFEHPGIGYMTVTQVIGHQKVKALYGHGADEQSSSGVNVFVVMARAQGCKKAERISFQIPWLGET